MKKQLLYCIILVALLASCAKEPIIYRLLPAEDAAAIPYHLGDTVKMSNENNDTITFLVTYDTIEPLSEDDAQYYYADDSKMTYIPGPYCYGRAVQLRSYANNTRMRLVVLPEKQFYFRWDYSFHISCQLNGETETININNVIYENVYLRQEYDSETGDVLSQWYYNEEVGLIAVKYNGRSLVRIP